MLRGHSMETRVLKSSVTEIWETTYWPITQVGFIWLWVWVFIKNWGVYLCITNLYLEWYRDATRNGLSNQYYISLLKFCHFVVLALWEWTTGQVFNLNKLDGGLKLFEWSLMCLKTVPQSEIICRWGVHAGK